MTVVYNTAIKYGGETQIALMGASQRVMQLAFGGYNGVQDGAGGHEPLIDRPEPGARRRPAGPGRLGGVASADVGRTRRGRWGRIFLPWKER